MLRVKDQDDFWRSKEACHQANLRRQSVQEEGGREYNEEDCLFQPQKYFDVIIEEDQEDEEEEEEDEEEEGEDDGRKAMKITEDDSRKRTNKMLRMNCLK